MASEAPSWADQWGAGGIGAMEDEDNSAAKKDEGKDKKGNGFSKAKEAAVKGAKKFKDLFTKKTQKKASPDPPQ